MDTGVISSRSSNISAAGVWCAECSRGDTGVSRGLVLSGALFAGVGVISVGDTCFDAFRSRALRLGGMIGEQWVNGGQVCSGRMGDDVLARG